MVSGKSTNSLMRIMRGKHGIAIHGSAHKQHLLNMGYFHGYKGYRFIKSSDNKIPYSCFDEVIAINEFDNNIKSIFYPHLMNIETALKNYTLEIIINHGSADFDNIFSNLLNDYKSHPTGSKKYRDKMKNKLKLRNQVHNLISFNYSKENSIIKHYIHNNKPVPLWAIFEVMHLGEFGFFIHCLNKDIRIEIAQLLDIHSTAHNQNGRILQDIIFLIKDLRNAVAHNGIVFDCRFKTANTPSRLKEFLKSETGINNIEFENIIDYVIITVYLLQKLGAQKRALRRIVRKIINESERLRKLIPVPIHTSIIGSDFRNKTNDLNNFI